MTARVLEQVGYDRDALLSAFAGAMVVAVAHALARFVAQRRGGDAQSEVGAAGGDGGVRGGGGAVVAARRRGADARGGAALSKRMPAMFPSWPMPGGYVARRVGRWFASTRDEVTAVMLAAGVFTAWLYARGLVLLPTALVAGGFEAAEGYHASRRHAHLASLPRFREWSAEGLARWRALLVAARAAGARRADGPRGRNRGSCAARGPRRRRAGAWCSSRAGSPCSATALVQRAAMRGDDPAPRRRSAGC